MNIKKEYGYVLIIALLLYITQQVLMIIPVMKERSSSNIKAPILYPRDSEIKELGLSKEQVLNYYRAQRVHQNNVEVMSVFMPLFLIAGFFEPTKVAIAGAIVWIFRLVGGIGYLYGKRMYGVPWHLGEIYLLYIIGKTAFDLLIKNDVDIE
jgi:uncharacterized MAPEG superfamily protein|tara:strand:- start:670 stop:1125 length:456 start_codon:yes stop_codon:yes gene_type:complete